MENKALYKLQLSAEQFGYSQILEIRLLSKTKAKVAVNLADGQIDANTANSRSEEM